MTTQSPNYPLKTPNNNPKNKNQTTPNFPSKTSQITTKKSSFKTFNQSKKNSTLNPPTLNSKIKMNKCKKNKPNNNNSFLSSMNSSMPMISILSHSYLTLNKIINNTSTTS